MTNGEDLIETTLNNHTRNMSHAYLFITNGDYDYQDIITKFVIKILSDSKDQKEKDKIYDQIRENRHSEVKTIKPDGMWIKKDQLTELKKEFSTKSLNSSKKVYIINEAEKLNVSSANSILKFLEEPDDNIIAILTTNNINNVLNTIVSRCQVINFQSMINNSNFDLYNIFKDYISKEKYLFENYGKTFIDNSVNFLCKLDDLDLRMISFSKEYYHKLFTNREEIEISIQIMIFFYKDVLRYSIGKNVCFFEEYIDKMNIILEKNDIHSIMNKIIILNQKKDLIKYNVNINLLIDSLIFEFKGVNL